MVNKLILVFFLLRMNILASKRMTNTQRHDEFTSNQMSLNLQLNKSGISAKPSEGGCLQNCTFYTPSLKPGYLGSKLKEVCDFVKKRIWYELGITKWHLEGEAIPKRYDLTKSCEDRYYRTSNVHGSGSGLAAAAATGIAATWQAKWKVNKFHCCSCLYDGIIYIPHRQTVTLPKGGIFTALKDGNYNSTKIFNAYQGQKKDKKRKIQHTNNQSQEKTQKEKDLEELSNSVEKIAMTLATISMKLKHHAKVADHSQKEDVKGRTYIHWMREIVEFIVNKKCDAIQKHAPEKTENWFLK